MSFLGRPAALAALIVAATTAVGCGETVIDATKTEDALEQNLKNTLHKRVSAVDCPSNQKVEAGATFTCTVNLAGGKAETATLKIVNKDADVEVVDLSPNK
jgi:hypothetical protein